MKTKVVICAELCGFANISESFECHLIIVNRRAVYHCYLEAISPKEDLHNVRVVNSNKV